MLEPAELLGIGLRPNTFSYAELRSATDDFNPSKKLGEGGFGPVFKVKYLLYVMLDRHLTLRLMTKQSQQNLHLNDTKSN